MTLTQLNAFVLVARLGSVRAAASALGVSESAVSQALTALRQDLGDQLITRSQVGMMLTPGGSRLLGTASQIVVLGAEAHAAVLAQLPLLSIGVGLTLLGATSRRRERRQTRCSG